MKKEFLKYCSDNKFEQNNEQIKALNLILNFYDRNSLKNEFLKFFGKNKKKIGFYLYGPVGVGKTMLLNFFLII